jgi:hypothetical protein
MSMCIRHLVKLHLILSNGFWSTGNLDYKKSHRRQW